MVDLCVQLPGPAVYKEVQNKDTNKLIVQGYGWPKNINFLWYKFPTK